MVITHEGARKHRLEMDWLEKDYRVDESDWIVLSPQDWRAVARGDASVWEALQRKFLVGFYLTEPELIAVIGHPLPGGGRANAKQDAMRDDVARIVRRVRSLHLPPVVMGLWTDEDGWLMDVVESDRATADIVSAADLHRRREAAIEL
jgi:hypothetical protein